MSFPNTCGVVVAVNENAPETARQVPNQVFSNSKKNNKNAEKY